MYFEEHLTRPSVCVATFLAATILVATNSFAQPVVDGSFDDIDDYDTVFDLSFTGEVATETFVTVVGGKWAFKDTGSSFILGFAWPKEFTDNTYNFDKNASAAPVQADWPTNNPHTAEQLSGSDKGTFWLYDNGTPWATIDVDLIDAETVNAMGVKSPTFIYGSAGVTDGSVGGSGGADGGWGPGPGDPTGGTDITTIVTDTGTSLDYLIGAGGIYRADYGETTGAHFGNSPDLDDPTRVAYGSTAAPDWIYDTIYEIELPYSFFDTYYTGGAAAFDATDWAGWGHVSPFKPTGLLIGGNQDPFSPTFGAITATESGATAAIPEPASLIIVAIGMMSFGFCRLRRRRA